MGQGRTYPTDHRSGTTEPLLLIDENRFAHAATKRLFGPLRPFQSHLVFISGPSGVGKSLLARQTLRQLSAADDTLKAIHVDCSEFHAEVTQAAFQQSWADLQTRYRQFNMLVFDDLHFLDRRLQAQWQFVWLLDEIEATGGRVLITSRWSPGEFRRLLPRVASRLHSGICTTITSPSKQSRYELAKHFSQTRQIPISLDVARLLADSLPVSPRELLANLLQIDTVARLMQERLDRAFALRCLNDEIMAPKPTISQVARAVAREFHLPVSSLRSRCRTRGMVLPRQCAMFLARELTGEHYARIGDYFGKRNHSTVLHARRILRTLLEANPVLRQQIARAEMTLTGQTTPGMLKSCSKQVTS